jgi:hypothetical protein
VIGQDGKNVVYNSINKPHRNKVDVGVSYPSTVRVEQGDHHWHVRSSDGRGHVQAESTTGEDTGGEGEGGKCGVRGDAECCRLRRRNTYRLVR